MFSKTNTATSQPEPAARRAPQKPTIGAPSILGPDLMVTGDIKSEGDIQVDGRHEGNIMARKITVGEHGAINGILKAQAVYVRGKVTGQITADVVELAESANVQADVIQNQLTIANGAFFDGKCSRLSKGAPAPAAAPAPQKAGIKTQKRA